MKLVVVIVLLVLLLYILLGVGLVAPGVNKYNAAIIHPASL